MLALIGVFAAATGLKNLFGSTIGDAAALGFLSDNLQISTEKLSAWQRASERAGGTSEGAIETFKGASDALGQLKLGLGPNESMQWLVRLGGEWSELTKGAEEYALEQSRIIHNLNQIDPAKAMTAAQQMGVANQFDFLKQGPDAIRAMTAEQLKNSAVTRENADDALKLKNSWLDFTQSLQKTAQTIILTIAPAITVVMQKFAQWADKLGENKDGIRKLGDDVEKFLTQTDWSAIIEGAAKFATAVGAIATGVRELSTDLRNVLDRWDEFTGKPKIKTEGVTKLPGAIRFGKSEDIAKDDAARAKDRADSGKEPLPPAPPRKPITGWQKDFSEGVEIAFARTMASLGHQPSKEFVRDTTGVDLYGAGQKIATPLPVTTAKPATPITRDGKSEIVISKDTDQSKSESVSPILIKNIADGFELAIARTLASLGHQESKEFVRDTMGVDLYNAGPKKPRYDIAVGNGNPPPPIKPGAPKPPPVPPKESRYAIEKLKGMGWSEAQSTGMVASLIQESDLDPTKRNKESGMFGIAQWDTSRRADFKAWSGKAIEGSSLDEQLAFMNHELTKGKEQRAGQLLRMTKTAEEAARVHSEKYERPSNTGPYAANVPRRQLIAGELMRQQRVASASSAMFLPSGAPASAPAVNNTNNNSHQTSTSTTEVKIANVNIQTQATDAKGIAKEIKPAIRFSFANQANTGLN